MTKSLEARILSPSQYEIWEEDQIDPAPPRIEQIIVREIDMVVSGGGISFSYSRPDKVHPHANLQSVLSRIKSNNYVRNDPVHLFHRPLDLNLKRPSYIVFFLSNSWNWRFSHKSKGVTLGELEDMDHRHNYWDLRHVMRGHADSKLPFPHLRAPEVCRIVYFSARPAASDYEHAFNLNVEILHSDVYGQKPNTIPIVIDPDIRNPGGSEG